MVSSPFEQFQINSLFHIGSSTFNISFTNSSLFMLIATSFILLFMYSGIYRSTFVPNKWQSAVEMGYLFILGLIGEQIGQRGYRYLPIIFTTFMFILSCNVLGMIPYSFTVTSHIIITLSLALIIFLGIQVIAGMEHGVHFFSFFLPPGAPLGLSPFLVVIEIISYVFRVISLAVRLFANMVSGHVLVKIIAGFGWTMLTSGPIVALFAGFPLLIVFALTGLELSIAFLQAYVFTLLICIYLNDAIHLH